MVREIFLSVFFLLVGTCAEGASPCKAVFSDVRHKATDAYNSVFSYDQPFVQYLTAMRTLIETHNPRAGEILHGSQKVGAAISPFEIPPKAGCSSETASKGILLIHGLTDTPYLMHELGEHFADRCFLVRSLLLPGHGTIPGDMTNVEYGEWIEATKYGVEELAKAVDNVYVAGFSTGGALALHYAFGAGSRDADAEARGKIRGLILLAPAIDVKNRFAWMADEKVWINRQLLNREAWRPVAPDDDWSSTNPSMSTLERRFINLHSS